MVRMEKPRAAHPWIARYCIRTLELLPGLPPRVAIQWAVSAYPYCGDIEPEHAAERHVDSMTVRDRSRTSFVLRRFFADEAKAAPGTADRAASPRAPRRTARPRGARLPDVA